MSDKIIWVKMAEEVLASPDRVNLRTYEKGEKYPVPEFLAIFFKVCGYTDPNYDWNKEEAQRITEEQIVKAREEQNRKQAEKWQKRNEGWRRRKEETSVQFFSDHEPGVGIVRTPEDYEDVQVVVNSPYLELSHRGYYADYQLGDRYEGKVIIRIDPHPVLPDILRLTLRSSELVTNELRDKFRNSRDKGKRKNRFKNL
jgi:hypothetical protein